MQSVTAEPAAFPTRAPAPPARSLRAATGWWSLLVVAVLSAASLWLYVGQLVDTNAYTGIVELPLGRIDYWWLMALWLLSLALLLPARPRLPSDLFLVLYLLNCCLWSAAYWPATGLLHVGQAGALAAVLLLPAVAVRGVQVLGRSVAVRRMGAAGPFDRRHLVPVLLVLVALAALLGWRVAGDTAGFAFEEASQRRLQGREAFSGEALPAYLLQMSANGLAPFLAYVGVMQRSKLAVTGALAFALVGFWLLGLKAPVLYVLLLAGLGWVLSRGGLARTTVLFVGGLAVAFAVSIAEMLLFDVSLVAEFFVRRLTLVSSVIQAYFIDALDKTSLLALLTTGFDLAGHATPEYYVGAAYMGSDLTNANTNAFLHQMALHGLFGYLAVVSGLCVFLAWCDRAWRRDGRSDGFAFATILGVLLVEQAFTTALVSSGLLLCMIISALFARGAPGLGRGAVS